MYACAYQISTLRDRILFLIFVHHVQKTFIHLLNNSISLVISSWGFLTKPSHSFKSSLAKHPCNMLQA